MMKLSKPMLAMLLVGTLILIVIITGLLSTRSTTETTITVVVSAPDSVNLAGNIDGEQLEFSENQAVLAVKPGTRSVTVTKDGFETFEREVTIESKQQIRVQANLKRTSVPMLNGLNTVTPASAVSGMSLQSVEYFGAHDWAFAKVMATATGNPAFVILIYADDTKSWEIVRGPVTILMSDETTDLPSDLVAYLNKNNYSVEGSL